MQARMARRGRTWSVMASRVQGMVGESWRVLVGHVPTLSGPTWQASLGGHWEGMPRRGLPR